MILLCLLVSLISFNAATADDELLSVDVVIRHADRAATQGWATPESEQILFRGHDQLTDSGIDNAFEQGKSFRKRYVKTGFVDNRYLPSEVFVRSSPVDRCLMSAASFTRALFTETSEESAVTPPIRSNDADQDWTLYPHLECGDGWQDVADKYNITDSSRGYAAAASDAMQATEWNCSDVESNLFDAVVSEYPNKLIRPFMTKAEKKCGKNAGREFMYSYIELLAGAGANFNPIRIKRNAGLLTNELITNFGNMNDRPSNCTEYKMRVYYTHDVVVQAIAYIFGVMDQYKGINLAFSSALVFETYKNASNQETYVKIFRKDGQDNDFDDTNNCDNDCSLTSVKQTVLPFLTTSNIPCDSTPKCQSCRADLITLAIDGNGDHEMDDDVTDRAGTCATRTFTCRGPKANIEINDGHGVVSDNTDVVKLIATCNAEGTAWIAEGVEITRLECASD